MHSNLHKIANKFNIESAIKSIEPLGEGFINDTFIVKSTDPSSSDYIFQRKNKNIFKNISGMMNNIERVTLHLKTKIIEAGGIPNREALTVIKTKDEKLFYKDEFGEYWTMTLFIKDHQIFETAETLDLAFSGGKGIGKFQSMLSDFNEPLIDTLPGFHDIKFRFNQWDAALKKNEAGRVDDLSEEISWIESRRKEMLDFWRLIEDGTIPKRITHNDTKLSNILFDNNGDVLCVIDLDTVLNSSVLNDFGDAIRSYSNTGKEDDEKLENVSMDINIFKSYTEGYLSEAKSFLTKPELNYLAFSARFITFEQVLRFLMDYIDGDNYYKIQYPNHNLIRTRAQYKLLKSIEQQYDKMNRIVKQQI